MRERGWTRTTFAEKAGLDPAEVTKYCDEGRAPLPSTGDEIAGRPEFEPWSQELKDAARFDTAARMERKGNRKRGLTELQREMLDAVQFACDGRPPGEITKLLVVLRGLHKMPLSAAVDSLLGAVARKRPPRKGVDEGGDEASAAQ